MLSPERFPGYTHVIIGVPGSRFPLVNLRLTMPLWRGRGALRYWLPEFGQTKFGQSNG